MATVEERRCGNPHCPDPASTSRLQKIPEAFTGDRLSEFFHCRKSACGRWCGFKGPPKKPGRKRKGETLAIPVGKRLDTDRCPPILRSIDALWGYRCSRPAARSIAPHSPAHVAARRLADLADMRMEERSQPLTDGSILEYIVHGEFAWKESDINSTYGAWWMSLRTIVREVGAEAVEEKLEEFDEEVDRLRAQAIKEALEDSSEDEEVDP